MNCVRWSIGDASFHGMGTSLVPHQDFACHPCPWTKLLPMCPDRTDVPATILVQRSMQCLDENLCGALDLAISPTHPDNVYVHRGTSRSQSHVQEDARRYPLAGSKRSRRGSLTLASVRGGAPGPGLAGGGAGSAGD